MCEEKRELVVQMLDELGMTRAELARELTREHRSLTVHESEMSRYLNGALTTPKAHRVIEDALVYLTGERERQRRLLDHTRAVL